MNKINKVFIWLLVILGLVFLSYQIYQYVIDNKLINLGFPKFKKATIPENTYVQKAKPFLSAKEYIYEATYKNFKVGKAHFKVSLPKDKNRVEVTIKAKVSTNEVMAPLYKFEAELESVINSNHYLPLVSIFSKSDSISKWKRQSLFIYSKKKVHSVEKGYRLDKGDYRKKKDIPITSNFFDELSAMFLLRHMKIIPGSKIKIPIIYDFRKMQLILKVGQETFISLPGFGSVKVLKTTPTLYDGSRKIKVGDFTMYLAPTMNNLPVKILARMKKNKIKLDVITILITRYDK
jgi:hypothetical protein